MSEMHSDTAVVAMDTQSTDVTAETAVAENDSNSVVRSSTSEVHYSGSGTPGECSRILFKRVFQI